MRMNKITGWVSGIVPASILALVCVALVNAQTATTMTGRITDRQGADVAGATVTLYARERPAERLETVTDKTGSYRFERLAPGEYLIEARGEGFTRSTAQRVRIESGANPALDISLVIAGAGEEVVVVASGTAQKVDEVSKTVTVVDQRELDDRDEFLIPEALRTVPGLRVSQRGGPGMPVTIRSRGLRPQDTAVLIDGLRLRDAAAERGDAGSLLSNLVITELSRVEVLRGSGSSVYGTNAIGGAINLVSNEGGGHPRGNLLLEGGSLGMLRGRLQVAGAAGEQDRFVYSAGLTHVNISGGVDGDDASRVTGGQWRVAFHITPKTTLSARVYATDAFTQLNQGPSNIFFVLLPPSVIDAVPLAPAEIRRLEDGTPFFLINPGEANFVPSINDPDRSAATRFFTGAIIFTQQPNESFGYTISYQGLKTDRSNFDGPAPAFFFRDGNRRQDNDGRIHTLNGRVDFRLGRANFINAGYEFEHEKLSSVSSFEVSQPSNNAIEVSQRSHTLFVQDQLNFLDRRLQLSVAFRAQFFSLGHPRFNPPVNDPFDVPFESPPNAYTGDGSIAYFFDETNTKLRAHVANGYRAPSLQERFSAPFNTLRVCPIIGCGPFRPTFSAFGDPRLRPERSFAFDAGIDQSLFDDRLRATATYFYTRLQGIIDSGILRDPTVFTFDPNGDLFGRFTGYFNRDGGLSRGLELSVTAAPTRSLDLFASYTYTNSDEHTPRDRFGRFFSMSDGFTDVIRSFIIPAHQFSLVASQRIGRRAQVNFDLVASSSYLTALSEQFFSFFQPIFRFKGLVKADLGASYTLPLEDTKSIRFFGKVENLFDQEYFEDGFRTPGRTGVAGIAFSF